VATFERAVKRNPDNEIPLIYLASSYGHLGRMAEAEAAIEAANDVRAKLGSGDLSLESVDPNLSGFSPVQGELDFSRFGSDAAQQRLRVGLSEIPALTWHSLITTRLLLDENNLTIGSYDINGAVEIDLATARSFHERGVVFIDTSPAKVWRAGHVPASINLPEERSPEEQTTRRLTAQTLGSILAKSQEVVFYYYAVGPPGTPWAGAKASKWGYQKVYYFNGGARAWKVAGYPIETGG
jgi:rhodanese-related sulfurtransferase